MGAAAGAPAAGQAGSHGAPRAIEYSPCSDATGVGSFVVRAVEEDGTDRPPRIHVSGSVRDGVVPMDVWEPLAEAGDCRLMVGPSFFCDPICGSSEACAAGGSCIAYPRSRSVGDVQIAGLAAEVSMSPSASNYYEPLAVVPYPGFGEGADIQLDAQGGDYAAFTLFGQGVRALSLADGEITVAREQPVNLRWAAQDAPGSARIHVELDVAHHGGTLARIECEAADTGALDVPAALVTQLLDRGVAGFPAVLVSRRTVDSIAIAPGCVEFVVSSEVARQVTVPGVVSCSAVYPCPDGQTCQVDLTCS